MGPQTIELWFPAGQNPKMCGTQHEQLQPFEAAVLVTQPKWKLARLQQLIILATIVIEKLKK